MKKLIFACAMIAASFTSMAQNAKKDANGNYVAVSHQKEKEAPKSTGKTFTDAKGDVYPVLESSRGNLYYMRTSKTSGKEYKVYIKTDPKG